MPSKNDRHPALQGYSRDHRRIIEQARNIRLALDGNPHAPPLEDALRTLIDYWKAHGLYHLREEEELLLPLAFPQDLQSRAIIVKLAGEHIWLRKNMEKLSNTPFDQIEEKFLRRILERLDEHVRYEEKEILDYIQENQSADVLEKLKHQSQEFRQKWRPSDKPSLI